MTAIIDGTNGVTTPNVLTSSSGVALTLQSGGTTAVTIDTSQNVGIGTASPTGKLHVSAPASTQYGTFDAVTASYAFTNYKVGGTAYGYIGDASGLVTSGTAGNLAIRFSGAMVFSGGADERMRINSGAPILCLAGGSTTATGTGIAFPATQSASTNANTLDDYEEGTWTPTLKGDNAATGQTYTQQVGFYVKVGKLVYANYDISLSAKGTMSGNVTISSLPFSGSGAGIGNAGGPVVYWGSMNTSWNSIQSHLGDGNNFANCYGTQGSGNATTASLSPTDLTNSTRWMGMLVYQATS